MWNVLNFDFESKQIYFENILWEKENNTFVFSVDGLKNKLFVILDGFALSFRFIYESYTICETDKYMSKNDIKTIEKHRICYTNSSEYLDWFIGSMGEKIYKKNKLYNFRIVSEDYIIDFISDAFPSIRIGHDDLI